MIVYLARNTGQAFVCEAQTEQALRKVIFEELGHSEAIFERIVTHGAQAIHLFARKEGLLSLTTLQPNDGILAG